MLKKKKKKKRSELGASGSRLIGARGYGSCLIGARQIGACGSELWIGAAMDRSYGSVQLWIGVVDRSCGLVLVTGAVERSCGSELLTERERDGWIGASDRSL